MKMPKEKHKHKLTHILKFAIFSIIMLAPFFAILSKIIYVSCNKNAKESYYGETINEEQYEKISKNNLVHGQTYYYISEPIENTQTQSVTIWVNNLTRNNQELATCNNIRFTYQNNINYLFYYSNSTYLGENNLNTSSITVQFDFDYSTQINNLNEIYNNFYVLTYNQYSYLDNAFYYAVNQIKQDNLFSWTKNSSLYGAINTMNTGLGLTNDHVLSYLLTYWALMTAIYIIFDIVIFAFEKMTHFYE